ncbi:extensin family protein [Thalassococcus sp. S3]|uniref:extensin-like domain-containing protein n=1 Tax=Thalassococcus sp. S3 TaxID=2017482 RepID=UPI00352C79EB
MVSRALTPDLTQPLAAAAPRLRPALRPPSEQAVQTAARPGDLPLFGPLTSLRPGLRPDGIFQRAMAKRREQRRGAICGSLDIQGEEVGFVPGRINGCGISEAVRVRSVSGIVLSQSALMDCNTAQALKTWVDKGVKPALRSKGQLVELRVAAHYACRTRNNQRGARISEHGKGRAIDISGFRMADGEVITVLNGWNARGTRNALRKMHRAACGPFGTVLGPNSDRFHQDHFHFDTARYRSGPFCR